MEDFFEDLLDVYRRNRRRINRGLNLNFIGRQPPEVRISEFCRDPHGSLTYDYLCCLALLFSNALGSQMPSHIHARMTIGESNGWVAQYMAYALSLKPSFLMYNPNKNNFRRHTIGPCGWIRKMVMK